jgi:hypothetical protein
VKVTAGLSRSKVRLFSRSSIAFAMFILIGLEIYVEAISVLNYLGYATTTTPNSTAVVAASQERLCSGIWCGTG